MDMPIPMPSPHSDDSEGSVLRNFVNQSIAQEHQSPSPRSELLSQTSHPGREAAVVDPGPSKRSRRSHKRPNPQRELVNPDASPDELLHLLIDQKQETHTLRRALRIAAERMDSEAQRVLALERTYSQTTEHFRALNESRVSAQQDAMKANAELRLYQFQLDQAQKEITRAQEALRMVEDQRDEAEEAAVRARAKARKYLQERMVAAAKEEGRRLGFEAGLRRAQEEQPFHPVQDRTRPRRNPSANRRRMGPDETGHAQDNAPANDDDILYDATDPTSPISSPTHHAQRDRPGPDASLEVMRVEQPPEPGPSFYSQPQPHNPPEVETFRDESPPPPEPVAIAQPIPDPSRPQTPSVQFYSVDIPPAAELERQYSLNEYPGRHTGPWVTARQYHEMTGQEATPRNSFQSNAGNGDRQKGGVTFAAQSTSPGKRKESWYRTLSRRLGRKRKPQDAPVSPVDQRAQPVSWYTSASRPAPPVLVRDYGMPKSRSLADSASISTRMSQLDIVSPPGRTPDGSESERSFVGGVKPRRKFKDKDSGLFVINEDPASRTTTPFKGEGDIPRGSPNMPASLSSQRVPTDADSNYSNPRAVDEWRRSTASVPREIRPPSGPKRPANLTVPAPLSPESARLPNAPRSRTMSNNTQHSGLRAPESIPRLDRQVSSGLSPIGITIEPPSRSPSEALGSARPQMTYLSPNQVISPSLRSAPSFPAMPSGHTPQNNYPSSPRASQTPLAPQQSRSRSGSAASHTQAQPYPDRATSSKSPSYSHPQPSNRPPSQQWPGDRSHRNSVSRATPTPPNKPLPPIGNGGDDISVHLGTHSAGRNTPRQNYSNLPSTNPQWGGTARSDGSHRRVVSESHLTPGPSHAGLPPVDGEQTLHRVGSNQSMRSANSKYSKYDGSQYLDPAFYPTEGVSVNVDKGKGVDRRSPRPMQRPPSEVSSELSYVTDPMLKAN